MAERRMFAKTIIDSDAFLEMPTTSQLLYFHLAMRADDDGFVNKPKSLMRMVGCHDDDLKLLFVKKFLIPFESGVVVIKHWKIHNYIRKDTYTATKYKEELSALELDENSAYRLTDTSASQIRDGSVTGPWTQERVGKDRDRIEPGEDKYIGEAAPTKPVRHKYGRYKNVLLTDDEMDKLKAEFPRDWGDRIERLSEYMASTGKSYRNYLATIRNWAKRDGSADRKRKKGSSFLDLVEDEE